MPKLWNDTLETHRQSVSEAIMQATVALVRHEGLPAVTMSRIAAESGIGRATLYKYFADVEAILIGWHERQITMHLGELERIRQATPDPLRALEAVLAAYCTMAQRNHGHALAALLHGLPHARHSQHRFEHFVRDLVAAAMQAGQIRTDRSAEELAVFARAALAAADHAGGGEAPGRLVGLIMDGLRAR